MSPSRSPLTVRALTIWALVTINGPLILCIHYPFALPTHTCIQVIIATRRLSWQTLLYKQASLLQKIPFHLSFLQWFPIYCHITENEPQFQFSHFMAVTKHILDLNWRVIDIIKSSMNTTSLYSLHKHFKFLPPWNTCRKLINVCPISLK